MASGTLDDGKGHIHGPSGMVDVHTQRSVSPGDADDGAQSSRGVPGRISSMIERFLRSNQSMSGGGSGDTVGATRQERRADVETALAWLRREMVSSSTPVPDCQTLEDPEWQTRVNMVAC